MLHHAAGSKMPSQLSQPACYSLQHGHNLQITHVASLPGVTDLQISELAAYRFTALFIGLLASHLPKVHGKSAVKVFQITGSPQLPIELV